MKSSFKSSLTRFCRPLAVVVAVLSLSVAATAAIIGAVTWFYEDADSFAANVDRRWKQAPGVAEASGGSIVVSYVSDGVSGHASELKYEPSGAPTGSRIIGEHRVSFDLPGDLSEGADDGSYVGILVTYDSISSADSYVFAVLDPLQGGASPWRVTSVPAYLTTNYVIRIEVNGVSGSESVVYKYKKADDSAAEFQTVASVFLPKGCTTVPSTVSYAGYGTVKSMELAGNEGGTLPYAVWATAPAVFTWAGSAADLSLSGGIFNQFDCCIGADSSIQFHAERGYSTVPRQEGITVGPFWRVFSGSADHNYVSPGYVLRFASGVGQKGNLAASKISALALGGLLVESGATGYAIHEDSGTAQETMFGDRSGKTACRIEVNENFELHRVGNVTFYGELDVIVASGKKFDCNSDVAAETKLDAATGGLLRFSGEGSMAVNDLDATGEVTLDCSNLSKSRAAPFLTGSVTIDSDTTIVLPSSVASGEYFALCSGSITLSGTVGPRVSAGGVLYRGTVSGGKVMYLSSDPLPSYENWAAAPGVFTWGGTNDQLVSGGSGFATNGLYRVFDVVSGRDTSLVLTGMVDSASVPGYEGETVTPWRVFRKDLYAKAPGYVLRFVNGANQSELSADFSNLALGGLLVEFGATGYSLAGDNKSTSDDNERQTYLGDFSGRDETYFTFNEDFTIDRHYYTFREKSETRFYGTINVTVAAGKQFDCNSKTQNAYPELDVATAAQLKMHGEGTMLVSKLYACGAVTLDFSDLSISRSTPFIQGSLEIDSQTRFVFPSSLAAGKYMQLCSGTLSGGVTGTYLVKVGSDQFYAKLTFSGNTVSYSRTGATRNRATISGEVNWNSIPWESSYQSSVATELVLSGDATIVFPKAVAMSDVFVSGGHRLTLVPSDSAFVPTWSTMTVAKGSSLALAGSDDAENPFDWSQAFRIESDLFTTGYLQMTNAANTVQNGGVLTVESGMLRYSGAEEGICGGLTVSSGAVFLSCGDDLLATESGAPTLTVYGELALGNTHWSLSSIATLSIAAGGSVIGDGVEGRGALDVLSDSAVHAVASSGKTTATLSAALRLRASLALNIDSGVVLSYASTNIIGVLDWPSAVTGEGTLSIGEGAELSFVGESCCSGGVVGSGVAHFWLEPKGLAGEFARDDWRGTCAMRGVALSDFDPHDYGNANSSVRLDGCRGYFAKTVAAGGPTLVLGSPSEEYPVALELVNGWHLGSVNLDKLAGDGRLVVDVCPHSGRYRVFISSGTSFSGSIEIPGEGNFNSVVLGAATDADKEAAFKVRDGAISVLAGDYTIATNATWLAEGGIWIDSPSTVTDLGEIKSAVIGDGTVIYSGSCADRAEEAALYQEKEWTGQVVFRNAEVNGLNLARAGNANSRILLDGVSGDVAFQTVVSPVELSGSGLLVTGSDATSAVVFRRVFGDGAFALNYGIGAAGSSFRFYDTADFTGAFKIADGCYGSILLGDVVRARAGGGAIEVPSGFTMYSNCGWEAPAVLFGRSLCVRGQIGDSLVKVTGTDVDFDDVVVTLINESVSQKRRFRLEYDADTKTVYVSSSNVPPSLTIEDIVVSYGSDFDSAIISLSVSDFSSGDDASSSVVADFVVRDATGRKIGAGSAYVTGDGLVKIGEISIPGGARKDYRYDVKVTVLDESTGVDKTIAVASTAAPAVRSDADWFHETPKTFVATDPAQKTGSWTYSIGAAYVVDDADEITINSSCESPVVFKPTKTITNDVLRVSADFKFSGVMDLDYLNEYCLESRLAAITLCETGKPDDDPFFAVWIPSGATAPYGSFVPVYCNFQPKVGSTAQVQWDVNTSTRTITYSVNGIALTNADGRATFSIPADVDVYGRSVRFGGNGALADLAGNTGNGNLAAVVNGSTTNQYATVAAARAAAVNPGDRVMLLWDATWAPTSSTVGEKFSFDLNGHQLTLDEKAISSLAERGYCMVDLGDGNYAVDVLDYTVTFEGNGGNGEMEVQHYTVTNQVFKLSPNQFERAAEGLDFAFWNLEKDGSGSTNYADGAEIDMKAYGLTNLVLYAQWRTAAKEIIVEAADEFVYIESVLTNNAPHLGVRYLQTSSQRTKAVGAAVIPIVYGSDLIIRFSTDIEKSFTADSAQYLEYYRLRSAMTIPYADLPKIATQAAGQAVVSPLTAWALSRGIAASRLTASPYSAASYALNTADLISEDSVVEITDFKIESSLCTFRVTIDGNAVGSVDAIRSMVRVAETLPGPWEAPAESDVTIGDNGEVTVRTASDKTFIKIVIPKN